MTAKYGPLLTDSQLREWREEVHQVYMDAARRTEIARRKDERLRRYIRRHYEMNYGETTMKGDGDGNG